MMTIFRVAEYPEEREVSVDSIQLTDLILNDRFAVMQRASTPSFFTGPV
jgi:hypothetical protein